MAVAIRLQRIGKKKQPYYRVVAVDNRRPAQGKPIEILGSYNPRAAKAKDKVVVKRDRVDYWVSVGAKPSSTVSTLLRAATGKNADVEQAKKKAQARKAEAKRAEGKEGAPAEASA